MPDVQVKVRMPAELHVKIAAAAEENKRSINAELNARLERTLSEEPVVSGLSMAELFRKLDELQAMIKAGTFVPFSQTEEGKAWTAKRKK